MKYLSPALPYRLLSADLYSRSVPGRPGVRTEHLEPRQEGPVLLPEGEAVPPESGQLNKAGNEMSSFRETLI